MAVSQNCCWWIWRPSDRQASCWLAGPQRDKWTYLLRFRAPGCSERAGNYWEALMFHTCSGVIRGRCGDTGMHPGVSVMCHKDLLCLREAGQAAMKGKYAQRWECNVGIWEHSEQLILLFFFSWGGGTTVIILIHQKKILVQILCKDGPCIYICTVLRQFPILISRYQQRCHYSSECMIQTSNLQIIDIWA